MSLHLVADANIPGLPEAVATLAAFGYAPSLRVLRSSEIRSDTVKEADLLFVRSTVRVDSSLLLSSQVRFVATATIGTDHMDLPWLERAGITAVSAPGCNAPSVVQWFASALCYCLRLFPRGKLAPKGPPLLGLRAGVVGVGNVGSRVASLLRALGAQVLRNDPPRQRREGPEAYVPLAELLATCDLITLHVPLNKDGPDRTLGLLDEAALSKMKYGAWLFNASRGEVVDPEALLAHRDRLGALVLDVFPGEPTPDPRLLSACTLCTPHIAGHSLEGKVTGTQMVWEAACEFLKVPKDAYRVPLPSPPLSGTVLLGAGQPAFSLLSELFLRSYDITRDDRALRKMAWLPPSQRAAAFRKYRETYPVRRELTSARLYLIDPTERVDLREPLRALSASLQEIR